MHTSFLSFQRPRIPITILGIKSAHFLGNFLQKRTQHETGKDQFRPYPKSVRVDDPPPTDENRPKLTHSDRKGQNSASWHRQHCHIFVTHYFLYSSVQKSAIPVFCREKKQHGVIDLTLGDPFQPTLRNDHHHTKAA